MNSSSDIKKILVQLGKDLIRYNLTQGSGGNISIKKDGFIYIKTSGAWFDEAEEDDYIKVPLEKGQQQPLPKDKRPSSEVEMHRACYKARKDIKCIVHCHPVYSLIFAMGNKELKAVTCEFAGILEKDVPILEYIDPGSSELAKEVSSKITDCNGLILSNHGIVTVGKGPKEALYRATLIEKEAKTILLSKFFSEVKYLDNETKQKIARSKETAFRKKRLE
jgi:L-fuculose-phosphate aldolase